MTQFSFNKFSSNTDLICVVHSHPTAPRGEVVHLPLLLLASISWRKHHLELAGLVDNKVRGPVLRD